MDLRKKKRLDKEGLRLTLLALPFVAFVLAFSYIPLFGWAYAFVQYKPGIALADSPFAGLHYFALMIQERSAMLRVLRNTLVMSFLNILCSLLPIAFAILLSELPFKRFKKFVQTATTLPYFISWIIAHSLVFMIFSSEGLWNSLFMELGWLDKPLNLLGDEKITWTVQTVLGIWKSLGWNAIIYLAALAGIDTELYDAASVDGAGRFRRIWHITIPGIMPTFIVLLLLSASNILSVGFDQFFVFYNPLVADKIEVIDYYVYRLGIISQQYSFSTAIGILKTLVSVTLLFSINTFAKRIRGEGII